jgi:hypothetical protein
LQCAIECILFVFLLFNQLTNNGNNTTIQNVLRPGAPSIEDMCGVLSQVGRAGIQGVGKKDSDTGAMAARGVLPARRSHAALGYRGWGRRTAAQVLWQPGEKRTSVLVPCAAGT